MRALEFITGHVIFKLPYYQIYQMKTTMYSKWCSDKSIIKCNNECACRKTDSLCPVEMMYPYFDGHKKICIRSRKA